MLGLGARDGLTEEKGSGVDEANGIVDRDESQI